MSSQSDYHYNYWKKPLSQELLPEQPNSYPVPPLNNSPNPTKRGRSNSYSSAASNRNNAPADLLHTTRKAPKRPRSNSTAPNNAKFHNHAKTIQHHLDKVKHVRVAGNPQNTSPMWEEYKHYQKIEEIAEDKQKLILAEIQAHDAAFNGFREGSRRKTRRNRA